MIGKLIKLLFLVAVLGAVAGLVSYIGARATVGKMVGNDPPLTARTISFAYQGEPDLPGKPRVWVFQYDQTRLPGVRRVTIYVSISGKIVSMKPKDLDRRLDAYARSLEPSP
jgi:hypothetical protein